MRNILYLLILLVTPILSGATVDTEKIIEELLSSRPYTQELKKEVGHTVLIKAVFIRYADKNILFFPQKITGSNKNVDSLASKLPFPQRSKELLFSKNPDGILIIPKSLSENYKFKKEISYTIAFSIRRGLKIIFIEQSAGIVLPEEKIILKDPLEKPGFSKEKIDFRAH